MPSVRSIAAGMTPSTQFVNDSRGTGLSLHPRNQSHYIDVLAPNTDGYMQGAMQAYNNAKKRYPNARNPNPAFKLESNKEIFTKELIASGNSHLSSIKSDNPLTQLNEFEKARGYEIK